MQNTSLTSHQTEENKKFSKSPTTQRRERDTHRTYDSKNNETLYHQRNGGATKSLLTQTSPSQRSTYE